jgi:site-specific DNA-methyltransferase (adenine-specific)
VATDPSVDDPRLGGNGAWKTDKAAQNVYEGGYAGQEIASSSLGRWPANFVHDGSDEVTALLGDAARFFYCPKASKKDREEGLEGFALKQTVGGGGGVGDYLTNVDSASGKFGSEKAPSKNIHPTVKPTDLMRYLCRLVTPP